MAFSLEEGLAVAGYGTYQQRLLWLCGLTQTADAMELLVITFLETQLPCVWPAATNLYLLTLSMFSGMLVGAVLGGVVADKYGRRTAYGLMTSAIGLFGLLSAFAQSVWVLCVCRFMVGVGLASPAALSLFAEFLPAAKRGSRLLSFFCFFSVGAVVEALVAWACIVNFPPDVGWRVMLVVSSLPAVLLFFVVPFGVLPESPRFLVVRGEREAAQAVLASVARVNGTTLPAGTLTVARRGVSPPPITSGRGSPTLAVADVDARASVVDLWAQVALRQRLVVLCVLYLLMAVVYYALVLLTNVVVVQSRHGGACAMDNTDFLASVVINAAELPGLFVSALLVDVIGRRATVASMFVVCGCAAVALAAAPPWAAVRIGVLFVARASALGFNQSLWVLTCEAFPTAVRTSAVGLATSFARIGGALAPTICYFYALHQQLGMLLTGVLCAIAASLVRVSIPEDTAGDLTDIVSHKETAALTAPPPVGLQMTLRGEEEEEEPLLSRS